MSEAQLVVVPATKGGFIVLEDLSTNGRFSVFLFAGHLDDCLAFIKDHFTPKLQADADTADVSR